MLLTGISMDAVQTSQFGYSLVFGSDIDLDRLISTLSFGTFVWVLDCLFLAGVFSPFVTAYFGTICDNVGIIVDLIHVQM